MKNKGKDIKKLYRDAAYSHLLRHGCSKLQARVWVWRFCN